MIVYLHGFRSSPSSHKARLLAAAMAARGQAAQWRCPALPVAPRAAIATAEAAVAGVPVAELALIGSSLGGYYATWLAERLGCRAVLLNPAIRPYEDLRVQLGCHPVFHSDATIELTAADVDELRAFDPPAITQPARYLLVAATGDEVIDWRTMAARYAGANQRIIAGSDHALTGFEQWLDEVLGFCGVHGRPQWGSEGTDR